MLLYCLIHFRFIKGMILIEDSGIADCCCILVEWLFMPKEYGARFYARLRDYNLAQWKRDEGTE